MTLSELLQRLEQRAQDAERLDASAPVATVLRAIIEDLRELDGIAEEEDHGLTPEELARLMGVGRRFVYGHQADFKSFRVPLDGPIRYSYQGYLRWCQRRREAA